MSTRHRRTLLPLAATSIVLAVGPLAACGDSSSDSKLLSQTSASELRSTLAQVQQTVESGDCGGAQEQVNLLEQQVAALNRVEADLRDALASGVTRLQQLVTDECQTAPAVTGTTGTTGPAATEGTTGLDEQQSGEQESGKKEKKPKKNKDERGDEDSGGSLDEGGGESGGGGTTGSGGFAP